jgi:hypothetical protein
VLDIQRSEMVGNRADLANLCDVHGLKIAVEIGTDRGHFAADFLARWHGEMLYCVDPYLPYPQMPWPRQADLLMAVAILAPFSAKVRICQTTSKEFAKTLTQVDFCYIDGAHDYESVSEDLRLWWPNVKPGGILAGDDFDKEHEEVMRAVKHFAEANKISKIWLSTDYNRAPSWWVTKAKPE